MNGDGGDAFARGMALIPALEEVTAETAGPQTKAVYDDLRARLRTPFVNLLFRLLATEPEALRAGWAFVAPIASTRGFERAARALREAGRPEATPAPLEGAFEKAEAARAFTEAIDYVLPKLLLTASLLDPEAAAPAEAGAPDRASTPRGVPEEAVKLPMVDPQAEPLRDLFEEIRRRHGHPKAASWWRGVGNDPALLRALWERIGPELGTPAREARRGAIVARAAALASGLREDATAPEAGERARAILAVFRRSVIPDLLLDVAAARALLGGRGPNRFDLA